MLIRKGDQGAEVGRVQQLLIEAGLGIEQGELAQSKFGDSTYDAVRQFQANHVDSHSHALTEDGVIGAETLWALMNGSRAQRGGKFIAPGWYCFPSEARAEIAPVLQWACGLIGTVEDPPGSNCGNKIDEWARAAGLEPGNPWCALFVSAAYHQLAQGPPFGWLASAYKILEWGGTNKRIVTGEFERGDIFVILRANYHGHVGLLATPSEFGKWCTIEGNASDAVRGLIRDPSSFAAVVRPVAG